VIDYSKLRLGLINLQRQYENLDLASHRATITDLDNEALRESVIKRFDVALEMTWKLLMKYLAEDVGLADLPNGPKPVFRLADQNNLLNGKIEAWLEYVNARNASSHDYSGEKAEETLKVIPNYIEDAISLYEKMSSETWTTQR
jgi:nucleotidyltransferase substrate binding protein (TIGR01987 family)